MLNAIGFNKFRFRKKKSKFYIIPPQFILAAIKDLTPTVDAEIKTESNVSSNEVVNQEIPPSLTEEKSTEYVTEDNKDIATDENIDNLSISALSISSIQKKREMESSLQKITINTEDLPKDPFTFEQLMEQWNSYAALLSKSGFMLMCSAMRLSKPELEGSIISIELPSEGTRISFFENQYDLVHFLRKKLNNYDIEIKTAVNEEIKVKTVFTPEDKYSHLNEINPALEMLVRTFKLDITRM